MLSRLDLPDSDETRSALADGVRNNLGSFSFTLSAQHSGLSLLFAHRNDILCTLSTLLSHLFRLNGTSEFWRELQISDRNIIENNVEFKGAFAENITDLGGHLLSLGDKLLSVVLGDDRLEHLVGDGGQDTLVVIRTDVVVDLGQFCLVWAEKDSKSDVNCLQVLSTGLGGHELGSSPDLEVVNLLEEGDTEVHAFTVYVLLQAAHGIHLEGTVATIDAENELCHEDTSEQDTAASLQHAIKEFLHSV